MDSIDIQWEKMSPMQMIDLLGVLQHEKKQREERIKEIGAKLIELGVLPLTGDAFKGILVAECQQYHLNKDALVLEMGQDWVDERSKRSTRAAYVLVKPLPAAAIKKLTLVA
jgi:hypothetical protein